MVGKTQGSYAATYAYRFGDKLKSVTSNFPGETASVGYNYDGLGRRRLEQRDNTTATWFRWSGWEECGEYAGTVGSWTIGALQTGYVPGLASFAGSNPATAEWRYHLTDHLGSVRQLTGQTKAALARYDYAPYGELMRNAGLPLTVGYTGHLWDGAIGQYYTPFRYYNPQTARWNMRDPLGFVDGPNVYAYVAGNPVNYTDPLGLDRCLMRRSWLNRNGPHYWIRVEIAFFGRSRTIDLHHSDTYDRMKEWDWYWRETVEEPDAVELRKISSNWLQDVILFLEFVTNQDTLPNGDRKQRYGFLACRWACEQYLTCGID